MHSRFHARLVQGFEVNILAIDPGTTQSAWCLYDGDKIECGIMENKALLERLSYYGNTKGQFSTEKLFVEMIASYGMSVGSEVFETCVWIGRFHEAFSIVRCNPSVEKVYRKEVKMHLCGTMKAKDTNIRQSLIDKFGAPGTKKFPGKTYGISKDMWAALAVAVTAHETKLIQTQ